MWGGWKVESGGFNQYHLSLFYVDHSKNTEQGDEGQKQQQQQQQRSSEILLRIES
jgi:hypothetical protein